MKPSPSEANSKLHWLNWQRLVHHLRDERCQHRTDLMADAAKMIEMLVGHVASLQSASGHRATAKKIETPDEFLEGWGGGMPLPPTFHAYAWRLYRAYAVTLPEAPQSETAANDQGASAIALLALLAETPPIQRWKEYEERGEQRIPCFIQVETAQAIAEFFPPSRDGNDNEQGGAR